MLRHLDVHSADRIVVEWQPVEVGMPIRLAAEVPLVVALVEPGRALVLRGIRERAQRT